MGRVREYELVMILSPVLDETEATATVDKVRLFITSRGGELTSEESWGMRRMAYRIQRFTEGNYILTKFTMDAEHTHDLSSSLNISEDVLRHLLVTVES